MTILDSVYRIQRPPDLSKSDMETATQSRERRRVALACREMSTMLTDVVNDKLHLVMHEVEQNAEHLSRQAEMTNTKLDLVLGGLSLLLGDRWEDHLQMSNGKLA